MGVLEWALPYHRWEDSVRLLVIGLGFVLLLWLVRIAFIRAKEKGPVETDPKFVHWSMVAHCGAVVLGVLQEIEQFGKPVVYWRLPLVLLIFLAASRALRVKM